MTKGDGVKRTIAVVLVAISVCLQLAVPGSYATEKLTILHVNDFHGRVFPHIDTTVDREKPMGGAAYLAEMVNEHRAENPEGVILVSAGDMFQGTPVSNLFRGRPVLDTMNMLRFDAMTLGNHEFDWGTSVLEDIVSSGEVPFVSANVVDRNGRYLPGMSPYIIIEKKGFKVAVIGLTTRETAYTTKRDNVRGLEFLEPDKVLPEIVKEARKKGAQLVVLLTHLGLEEDKRLARALSVDVIVGGHSHTVLTQPVFVNRTVIVHAGYNGLYLGVLELTLDEKSGKLLHGTQKGRLRPVSAGPNDRFDKGVARMTKSYNEAIKNKFEQIVGESEVDLDRCRDGESILGDVITDGMRESARADIAVHNSAGIRADISAGAITLEQVYTALPFDNDLVAMDLKGRDLVRLFEKSAGLNKGMLQVSGAKIVYDMGAPEGRRVVEVRIAGAPLDPSRIYRIVTNDFLAAGGDNFTDFRKGENITWEGDLREVFIEYLKRHSPVAPRTGDRIVTRGR